VIRESFNPGFVTRVDLVDTNNVYHTVFAGTDPSPINIISDFTVNFATTPYLVKGVKVYIDPNRSLSDWEEIDAVRLDGSLTLNSGTVATGSNTNLSLPSAGTGGSVAAGVFAPLNDDVTQSTINVTGLTTPVTDVNVSVQIDYPVSGDLEIRLVAPDGTIIPLANQRPSIGSGGNYFTNTTFDDQAANPIATAVTPYSTVRPEGALSVLVGMPAAVANGAWTLQVKDNDAANVGTLVGWSLAFNSTGAVAPSGNFMDQNANSITAETTIRSGIIIDAINVTTGTTPATTIFITTAASHGLATGDQVTIAGVTGNTAANGTFTIAVEDSTTFYFTVPLRGNPYQGGGVWSTQSDLFAIPQSAGTTIPFAQPLADETLPLIVPGPHMVSSSVPGSPLTADNLVLNKTNDAIDITFDRDILVSSFTP
jgi:subtilisin-like proprotein convertase family protein